jgi:hypothetical protein
METVWLTSTRQPKYAKHQPESLELTRCGIPAGGARRCAAPGCGDKIKDQTAYRGVEGSAERWYHDLCVSDGKVEDWVDR